MVPKWTLPATDGARVATDSLIRNTILAGAKVDVLCLSQLSEKTDPEFMKKAWNVENVFIVPRNLPVGGFPKKFFYLRQLIFKPLTPLTFSSFSSTSLKNKVKEIVNLGEYDILMLDGLHLGISLLDGEKFFTTKKPFKVIYRAHNIEVDLWKKAYQEKKSLLLKLGLYFQSTLVEKFEKLIINNSHGIAAIAQEDLVEIRKISKKETELIPLGLNFDHGLEQCMDEGVKFLFIGRLDWPPNKDGLEWLLKEVWPTVIASRPEAKLKIVGSGNKDWLKNYEKVQGLEIKGFVDTLKEAYQDCHFTIVPITYGSGTRIKVIEAFSMSRKLISTKMGVQGADLEQQDYINAETKEEWVRTLSTITLDDSQKSQLRKSRDQVALKFGEKNIGSKFYGWLKTFA